MVGNCAGETSGPLSCAMTAITGLHANGTHQRQLEYGRWSMVRAGCSHPSSVMPTGAVELDDSRPINCCTVSPG